MTGQIELNPEPGDIIKALFVPPKLCLCLATAKWNLKVIIDPSPRSCLYEKPPFYRFIDWLKRKRTKCILHPLIHTIPFENQLQDVGGGSQRANYELKYVNFKQNSADFRS